ncbi:MAG: alpha/beta fold hydrolase, partial [Gammaproteobacteria bacterium]
LERDQQIERVRLQGISALKDLLISKLVPRYLVPGDTFALSEFDRIVDMGLSVGCDAFIRQNQALRDRPDSTDTLASISVPTLVLCGEYDQLCTVAVHRTMADAIPQAHLTVLEGCGHLSSMQCPDQVTQALKDWLVRCQ